MKEPVFFYGQNVSNDDLTFLTDEMIQNECIERLLAVTAQQGIFDGVVLSSTAGSLIDVTAGKGYTESGERVDIDAQSISAIDHADGTWYLVIDYDFTDSNPIAHPVDGVLHNTRRTNTASLLFTKNPTTDQIILCKVTSISGPGVVSYDESCRQILGVRIPAAFVTDAMMDPNGEINKHANRFAPDGHTANPTFYHGTGTWATKNPHAQHVHDLDGGYEIYDFSTYHQQRMHHGGVVGDAASAVPSVPGSPGNRLILGVIPSGSYLHANGAIIEAREAQNYDFAVPSPAKDHLWIVGVDSTGTTQKYDRASCNAAVTITNCRIIRISQNMNVVGSKNLVYTYTAGPPITKTLAWNGGAAVAVQDTGILYRLWDADGINYIDVVVYGALPGSSRTDAYTLTALPADLYTKALICTINQAYTGDLIADTLLDIRSIGTVGWRELSSQVFNFDIEQPANKLPDYQMVSEIDAGFVVHGLDIPTISPPSVSVAVNGGICWINGLRLTIPGGVLSTTTTGTWYVFAYRGGSLAISQTDLRNIPGPNRNYLLLYTLGRPAAYVTSAKDQRNFGYGALSHPVLEDGTIGGPPTFKYGLHVESGSLTFDSPDANSLVGRVVYEDNLGFEIINKTKYPFVKTFFKQFGGDGSDYVGDITTNTNLADNIKQYTSLTIRAGATLTCSNFPILAIGVQGTLIIEGTGKLSVAGTDGYPGTDLNTGGAMGPGPGGNGGNGFHHSADVNEGTPGLSAYAPFGHNGIIGSAGGQGGSLQAGALGCLGGGGGGSFGVTHLGSGGASGGTGGTKSNVGSDPIMNGSNILSGSVITSALNKFLSWLNPNQIQNNLLNFLISAPLGCGGGGAGGGGQNDITLGHTGGGGGGGGGALIIECDTLDLAGSGCITAKGGDGGNNTPGNSYWTAGGGGGGGGTILIFARTVTNKDGTMFSVDGGIGGFAPLNGGPIHHFYSGNGATGTVVVISFDDFPGLWT